MQIKKDFFVKNRGFTLFSRKLFCFALFALSALSRIKVQIVQIVQCHFFNESAKFG